jgi:hypothetical protein
MESIEIIKLIIGSGGFLGITFIIFRMGRMTEKFDNLLNKVVSFQDETRSEFKAIRADLRELNHELSDVKERVAFIESFVFFSEIQAESNNPRSDAARKMWERRKMKKLESRGK